MPQNFRLNLTDNEGGLIGQYDIEVSDAVIEKIKATGDKNKVLSPAETLQMRDAARDIRLDMRDEVEEITNDIVVTIRQSL